MTRFTLKSSLAGIALAGILAATALPVRTHAQRIGPDGRPISDNTVVSYGRPTVAIDNYGLGKSDQQLQIQTHWECQTALDKADDPFTCVRVKDADLPAPGASTSLTGVSGLRVGLASHVAGHPMRRRAVSGAGLCASGGIKIYEAANFLGNCARFTGTGYLWLKGEVYPINGPNVGWSASSLRTIGSNGHGELLCPNANSFPFNSSSEYHYIGSACNDNVDWLVSN